MSTPDYFAAVCERRDHYRAKLEEGLAASEKYTSARSLRVRNSAHVAVCEHVLQYAQLYSKAAHQATLFCGKAELAKLQRLEKAALARLDELLEPGETWDVVKFAKFSATVARKADALDKEALAQRKAAAESVKKPKAKA